MPLNVYQNDSSTVVAESPEDAAIICAELIGLSVEEWQEGEEPFELLPPERVVTIGYEDEEDVPAEALPWMKKDEGSPLVEMPCSEWVKGGKGLIGSSEW